MTLQDKLPINELYKCCQGEGPFQIPTILIRFVGCRLRCQFGNSFCDTFLNSWSPEKGKYSMQDIIDYLGANSQIKHILISGGGPTLNAEYLMQLCAVIKYADSDYRITIETEGSEFVKTQADYISLSPKLKSSTPKPGSIRPDGKIVTESDRDRHEKWRTNYDAMRQLIDYHSDYWLKPVVSDMEDLKEIKLIQDTLNIPNNKVWLMPAGVTFEQLNLIAPTLVNYAVDNGYRYSDRLHIRVFGNVRLT